MLAGKSSLTEAVRMAPQSMTLPWDAAHFYLKSDAAYAAGWWT